MDEYLKIVKENNRLLKQIISSESFKAWLEKRQGHRYTY